MKILHHESSVNLRKIETKRGSYTDLSKTKSLNQKSEGMDQMEMSSVGKKLTRLIRATKIVGPKVVKRRLMDINEKMATLQLDDINVDEMSRESLTAKIEEVQDIILEIRSGADVNFTDFEGKTDQELKDLLTKIVERVDTAKEDFTTVKSIVSKLFDHSPSNDTSNMLDEVNNISKEDIFEEVIASLEADGSDQALELSKAMMSYLEIK